MICIILESGYYTFEKRYYKSIKPDFILSPGYYQIRGKLRLKDFKTELRLLFYSHGKLVNSYKLPVTCAGTIIEIVEIRESADEIVLDVSTPSGFLHVTKPIIFKSLNSFESKLRKIYRVISYYRKDREIFSNFIRKSLLEAILEVDDTYNILSVLRDCNLQIDYNVWLKFYGKLSKKEKDNILYDIKKFKKLPNFLVFLIGSKSSHSVDYTLKSINDQLYKNFTLIDLRGEKISLKYIVSVLKDFENYSYVIFLNEGSLLSEDALYYLAKKINECEPPMIYVDHDFLDETLNRYNPWFKPDFSLEYLRSMNYIDSAFSIRSDILLKLLSDYNLYLFDDNFYSLHLALSEITRDIIHIPKILFHIRRNNSQVCQALSAEQIVEGHFKRMNIRANFQQIDSETVKVIYQPLALPEIEIIIPTKDKVDILKKCIESILNKTTYPNYRITIVDNNSKNYETINFLKKLKENPRFKVIEYRYDFNFSAINNFAVQETRCEVVVFLNNDTEIITPNWLEIMLGCLSQPKVGAVGVKMYYPNDLIQHAGVVIGPGGCADHAFKGLPREDHGYMKRAILQQEYLAVTAGCMMTYRDLFLKVGGFDQTNLPVNFNDVDYCLKLYELGYRIIFTPYVELYHHESLTRAEMDPDGAYKQSRREADYVRKKWEKYILYDPYYNPNLNYKRPDFTLNLFPRFK